jgi:hypothetical protein
MLYWDLLASGRYQPAVLGSSDQRKVLAILSLFLNSEKIPALLYIRKGPEYRPSNNFQPDPSAYISNHTRACTQALLIYILTLL